MLLTDMHDRANCFGDGRIRNIGAYRPHWRNAEDQDQNWCEQRSTAHTGETYEDADQQSDERIAKVHNVPPPGSLLTRNTALKLQLWLRYSTITYFIYSFKEYDSCDFVITNRHCYRTYHSNG